MYTTVLLSTLVLTIIEHQVITFIIWILLLINMLIKFNREEKLMTEKFPEYEKYKQKTKALIPFLI